MHVEFAWVVYGLVGIAIAVALGLKYFTRRHSSSGSRDPRVAVALLSALMLLHASRYMDPDRQLIGSSWDSPLSNLLGLVLILLAINEAVWRARGAAASAREQTARGATQSVPR